MRNYLSKKWNQLKNSRFLLGLVCLIIGFNACFIWIEGTEFYNYVKNGLGFIR